MTEPFNVLLVVLGGTRADHVSCYGYARETTPMLDRVAREGVRFQHMIANAGWVLPAHASLFTGRPAVLHGATDEQRLLLPRFKTLPEYLRAAGYRTAAFCTNPWISPTRGFGSGFDAFFTQQHHNRLAARALLYGRRASDRLLRRKDCGARRTTLALKSWLKASDRPFFAFVRFNEPQLQSRPPAPYDRLFMQKDQAAGRAHDTGPYLGGDNMKSEEDLAVLNALYDGALRYVDRRLGEIADFLQQRGEWDRTLVVVTADHGEELGDHRVTGHDFVLYDTVLRVPLLLRCPTRIPQGFVVEELAQTTDIMPTILRLLDITDDADRGQGRALLDAGRATRGPGFAVAERFRPQLSDLQPRFPDARTRALDVRQKVIRTKREKFVWHSDEANELYDLVVDPGEHHNLIEQDTERADGLRRRLFDWLAAVERVQSDGRRRESTERDVRESIVETTHEKDGTEGVRS